MGISGHRRSRGLAVALAVLLGAPAVGAGDAPAPPLAVPEDPAPPRPSVALAADPLGIAFGHYGLHVEVAVGGPHGLWLMPGWARGAGPALELGYHLWPLGRGLVGPFLGPLGGVVLGSSVSSWQGAWLGGEVGYQHAWSGLLLGVAVGAVARWSREEVTEGRPRAEARVRLALGWVWSSP
jgi:hypothetical protein